MVKATGKKPGGYLFTSRRGSNRSLTTRQYARLVGEWIASDGLDPHLFGTHSLHRTKTTLIYRRTGNLRAVQRLLGYTKIESTVRYLGTEVDNALAIQPSDGHGRGRHARSIEGASASARRPSIEEHRGRIVKTTGDGMLVEFASVVDAVRCAVDVQRGMSERNARVGVDKRIEFRVGINLGDIIIENDDIYGDGVGWGMDDPAFRQMFT